VSDEVHDGVVCSQCRFYVDNDGGCHFRVTSPDNPVCSEYEEWE
jgi:hypothetical protein